MESRKKIYYLLNEFQKGNYDVDTFCDQFTIIYDLEIDYKILSEKENELFSKLSIITARFSPYEEDLKIPNMYYNEKDVRDEVNKILSKL